MPKCIFETVKYAHYDIKPSKLCCNYLKFRNNKTFSARLEILVESQKVRILCCIAHFRKGIRFVRERPYMTETNYQHAPDRPWIFRTYAGHSTAAESNAPISGTPAAKVVAKVRVNLATEAFLRISPITGIFRIFLSTESLRVAQQQRYSCWHR